MTATMTRHRISVAEYEAMGARTDAAQDRRTELLDGAVFEMSPIGLSHAWLVRHIRNRLYDLCGANAIVDAQHPVVLDLWSMPEPDVTVLKPSDDDYRFARPTPGDILLLIEVSDTSLRLDRGKKLTLYAAAGVPLVWIVNVTAQRILVFDSPVDGVYTNEAEVGVGDTVAVPGVSHAVPVKDLIGE